VDGGETDAPVGALDVIVLCAGVKVSGAMVIGEPPLVLYLE